MRCYQCRTPVDRDRVGVRDVCPRCSAYLHCCRNCDFYLPGASNDCREPNAPRVADKEQGNFCDYFRPAPSGRVPTTEDKPDARARLEKLFARKDPGSGTGGRG